MISGILVRIGLGMLGLGQSKLETRRNEGLRRFGLAWSGKSAGRQLGVGDEIDADPDVAAGLALVDETVTLPFGGESLGRGRWKTVVLTPGNEGVMQVVGLGAAVGVADAAKF